MKNSNLRILIADDDIDDIRFLKDGIAAVFPAAETVETYDGMECLRYLKTNNPPDLIFLDLNMPIKGGLQCLKDIEREQLLPAGNPVVVYSTSHNIKDIDTAFRNGAALYLVKPTSLTGLIKLLHQVDEKIHETADAQIDLTRLW